MSAFRIVALSLVIAVSAVPAAFAQLPARGNSMLLSETLLNRHGLTRAWWSHATINSKRDKLAYMVVDETHLFLQATSGVISAFDTDTGRYLWTKQVGLTDQAINPATSNDELLFVVNGTQLFGIDKNTGHTEWKLGMPGMPATSPVADDTQIYVGLIDGSLYAFDLKKIRELYSEGKLPQFSEVAVVWRYRTSKTIAVPAVTGKDVVAFASRNGSLYSVMKKDRKLSFQFETDSPLSAPVVHYHGSLLLATQDSDFYSMDMRSGKLSWKFTAGVVIHKAPVLIDSEVYLFPDRGNMYKLSADTGRPYWSVPRMIDFLAASTARVYVTDKHNNFSILSRENGELLGMFPLGQFTKHLANDHSDRIYLATESGLLMCLHEQRSEFARFHMHPDRQPILPELAPEGAGDEDSAEMDADGDKPDADKPDTDKPDADKPDADKPEADPAGDDDKPAAKKPAAEKAEDDADSDADEKPEAEKPAEKDE